MPVRKTESRVPAGLQPSDLGQASVSADGRFTLVSFYPSPVVTRRANGYVVFVTDAGLAATVQQFGWTFTENGEALTYVNDAGALFHEPFSTGPLTVDLRLLDGGGAELASLQVEQLVVTESKELEAIIADAAEAPGAGASDPEALRELVNEYSRYYRHVVAQSGASDPGLQRLTFTRMLSGAIARSAVERRTHLEALADALNTGSGQFTQLAASGIGICDIRLTLLAMTGTAGTPPVLAWTELPERTDQRALADEALRKQLGAVAESAQIDLFNILRFPKSQITHCARILEALRDRYFPGTDFEQVLTGMSGTRAHWIMRHFSEGPLVHD